MKTAYMVTAVLRLGAGGGVFALETLRPVWHFLSVAQRGRFFMGKKCSWNLPATWCDQAAAENTPFWKIHLTVPVCSDA